MHSRRSKCESIFAITQQGLSKSVRKRFVHRGSANGLIAAAITVGLFSVGLFGFAQVAFAESGANASRLPAKSLDEQVQEIKGDVLAIAAELSNLEEKLIYPSNTQVAIFVEVEADREVPIQSARLSIDGELVAHHIYTFKELQALRKGGVQRIFTGNLPTGEHRLEVVVNGERGAENEFELAESFKFDKQVNPKLVGITLGAGAVGNPTLAIKNW
ncbi:MAG: hypothetical protein AB8G23_08110 [Myxococcota bacterium]